MTEGFRPYSGIRILDMARDIAPGATRFSADRGAGVAQPPSTRPAISQKEETA